MGENKWGPIQYLFNNNKVAGVFVILSLIVWLVLFGLGLAGYSGSKAVYGIFLIATGAMLIAEYAQTTSYGYLFL